MEKKKKKKIDNWLTKNGEPGSATLIWSSNPLQENKSKVLAGIRVRTALKKILEIDIFILG